MPKTSRETAPIVVDHGPAADRTDHLDNYTVNFVSIKDDADLAMLLMGLPDDSCQCPHWGYVFAGTMTMRFADREETYATGDAFYVPPGHVPSAKAGTEFVQFSPTGDLEISEAAIQANAQRLMQGNA